MWIWVLLTLSTLAGQAAMADDFESCDHKQIMNCFYSASGSQDKQRLFFLDIPDTSEKLKEQCSYMKRFSDCVHGLVDSCATQDGKQYFQELSTGAVDMNTELCTEGSSLSTRYLANMNCYQQNSEMFKTCAIKFIENAGDVQGNKTAKEKAQVICCSFYEYRGCMSEAVTGSCSEEAVELLEESFKRSLNTSLKYCNDKLNVPTTICQKNVSASHSLSSVLLFVLLFIYSSKTIYFKS